MWETVLIFLGLGAFLLILRYITEPKKVFEDVAQLRGSDERVAALELEVKELKEKLAAQEKGLQD